MHMQHPLWGRPWADGMCALAVVVAGRLEGLVQLCQHPSYNQTDQENFRYVLY
jgi:hypothetical protein